jgi:hypothetical protein
VEIEQYQTTTKWIRHDCGLTFTAEHHCEPDIDKLLCTGAWTRDQLMADRVLILSAEYCTMNSIGEQQTVLKESEAGLHLQASDFD